MTKKKEIRQYTTKQIAELFGVQRQTVNRWINKKRIPENRIIGRAGLKGYLIDADWIDSRHKAMLKGEKAF